MSRLKKYLIEALAVATVFAVSLPNIISGGQWIESNYFPVVNNFELTQVEAFKKEYTFVSGKYNKLRECDLLYTEWTVSKNQESSYSPQIPEGVKETNTSDFTGKKEFRDLLVLGTPEKVRQSTKAMGYFNCHPFWSTYTVFYNTNEVN